MRRKILILPAWYPSDASPVNGIFVQEQAALLSQEYDVRVLVPRWVTWRAMLKGDVGPASQVEDRAGLRVYRERALAPIPLRIPGAAYSSYLQAASRGFDKLLAEWGKPDIIHAHVVLPAGWAAMKLGKRHGILVVLTEHSSPFSMHLQNGYARRLVKETLEQVDRIVAVSPAMAEQIHDFCNDVGILVVGELIKTEFFVPWNGVNVADTPVTHFLSIALLSKQKGLVHLLEAARLLIKRGITSFRLTIGGDGPERPALEKAVSVGGLSGWCSFLGLLEPAEVRRCMQQCDVFVLPSLHETFGIVLGEAMACGKPVIATRCGGPEFVVTSDTGMLVDAANPFALADAMENFIAGRVKFNPQVIRQRVVERFGEAAFLSNISQIYNHVIEDRNVRYLWHLAS